LEIHLENIGRRYNREWIFKSLTHSFQSGDRCAILGPNGSGKSTLIKVLSGYLTASEGSIEYQRSDSKISIDELYAQLSIAAPYIDLIEDFTLAEMITFHFKFKKYRPTFDNSTIIDYLGLQSSTNKEIKYFSSGMKQRLKLALACFSDTEILLLDEPTSNLDAQGIAWYHNLMKESVDQNRILIIGSNQPHEYEGCTKKIHIQDYKHT